MTRVWRGGTTGTTLRRGFDQHDEHYYDKVKQVGSPFAARHAWTYEKRCVKQLGNSGEKGTLKGRVFVH